MENSEILPLEQLALVKPDVAPTGDERVDAALARLNDTESLPINEQVDVFDEVHRRLQDVLADAQG